MSYKDQEIQALLYGVKSARSLAHRCRALAPQYRSAGHADWADFEMSESRRQFARAHWYLDTARMMRSELVR